MESDDTPPEVTPDESTAASNTSDGHEMQSNSAAVDTGRDTATTSGLSLPRRGVLGVLASLGLVGAASELASAHHTEPKMSVSDSGTVILRYPDDLNFGANLSVTDDGDRTVTIEASSGDGDGGEDGNGDGDGNGASTWTDSDGDGLLEPTDGFEGIDTTGVSNGRVLTSTIDTAGSAFTLAAGTTSTTDARNIVLGHASNAVHDGVVGATITGGGFDDGETARPNQVFGNYGTVLGGRFNQAGTDDEDPKNGEWATVGGGRNNTASGPSATISGGNKNTANDVLTTIGGGSFNTASDLAATVGGGGSNTASAPAATVGGGDDNKAQALGATIGGGGDPSVSGPDHRNVVHDNFGTIGGGTGNQVGTDDGDPESAETATVGGGGGNSARGKSATVGGGGNNTASADYGTVSGGLQNTASGVEATVAGGRDNTASGTGATIPGGRDAIADGDFSFAAGHAADTNGHNGAFVLGDSSSTAITAQNDDEVRSQMPMYAPSFNTTSARAAKTAVEPVDPQAVLAGVNQLDVRTWDFTNTDDGRHIGPMADDFHETFAVGGDGETIASVDADGVAFAAIQGLAEKHETTDDRLTALETENERLREELATKDARIDDLATRVATLEDQVDADTASDDD